MYHTTNFTKNIKKLFKKAGEGKGFTLIDTMVTLSLFVLLITVVTSSYPNSSTKIELANAVSDMQAQARDAQIHSTAVQSADGKVGGYGLYFNSASTTSFAKFKDLSADTSGDPTKLVGDGVFDRQTELMSLLSVPSGFYIRNICVGNDTALPFATSTCSRTNPAITDVTVSYSRFSSNPSIVVGNATSSPFVAACIELASTKSLTTGFVKNMIISGSGFSSTNLGACDEKPGNVAVDVSFGSNELLAVRNNIIADTVKSIPIITLNGSSEVELLKGDSYSELGATATDSKDGDITSKIKVSVESFTSSTSPIFLSSFVGNSPFLLGQSRTGKVYLASYGVETDNKIYTVTETGVKTVFSDVPAVASIYNMSLESGKLNFLVSSENDSDNHALGYYRCNSAKYFGSLDLATKVTSFRAPNQNPADCVQLTSDGRSGSSNDSDYTYEGATRVSNGDVYIGLGTMGGVGKYSKGGNFFKRIAYTASTTNILYNPNYSYYSMTSDGSDNVYAVSMPFIPPVRTKIVKIASNDATSTYADLGAASSTGLVADSSGSLYTYQESLKQITKINTSGVASKFTTYSLPVNKYSNDMIMGKNGNIFISSTSTISKISPAGTVTVVASVASSSANIMGFSLDDNENVYYAEAITSTSKPISFYSVSSASSTKAYLGVSSMVFYSAISSYADPVAKMIPDGSGGVYAYVSGSCSIERLTPGGINTTAGNVGVCYGSYGSLNARNLGSSASPPLVLLRGSDKVLNVSPYSISEVSGSSITVLSGNPSGAVVASSNVGENNPTVLRNNVDENDNLYLRINSTIYKIKKDGTSSVFATGVPTSGALTVKKENEVYVSVTSGIYLITNLGQSLFSSLSYPGPGQSISPAGAYSRVKINQGNGDLYFTAGPMNFASSLPITVKTVHGDGSYRNMSTTTPLYPYRAFLSGVYGINASDGNSNVYTVSEEYRAGEVLGFSQDGSNLYTGMFAPTKGGYSDNDRKVDLIDGNDGNIFLVGHGLCGSCLDTSNPDQTAKLFKVPVMNPVQKVTASSIDSSKIGVYLVKYEVTNSDGIKTVAYRKVNVVNSITENTFQFSQTPFVRTQNATVLTASTTSASSVVVSVTNLLSGTSTSLFKLNGVDKVFFSQDRLNNVYFVGSTTGIYKITAANATSTIISNLFGLKPTICNVCGVVDSSSTASIFVASSSNIYDLYQLTSSSKNYKLSVDTSIFSSSNNLFLGQSNQLYVTSRAAYNGGYLPWYGSHDTLNAVSGSILTEISLGTPFPDFYDNAQRLFFANNFVYLIDEPKSVLQKYDPINKTNSRFKFDNILNLPGNNPFLIAGGTNGDVYVLTVNKHLVKLDKDLTSATDLGVISQFHAQETSSFSVIANDTKLVLVSKWGEVKVLRIK